MLLASFFCSKNESNVQRIFWVEVSFPKCVFLGCFCVVLKENHIVLDGLKHQPPGALKVSVTWALHRASF